MLADIDNYSELYYTRALVEPGDFAISMPLEATGSENLEIGHFVTVGDEGKRLGIIEGIEKKHLAKGTAWIVARGHEAKSIFTRRLVFVRSRIEPPGIDSAGRNRNESTRSRPMRPPPRKKPGDSRGSASRKITAGA